MKSPTLVCCPRMFPPLLLTLLLLAGCGTGPRAGVPIAGCPDGAAELVSLSEAGEIEHIPGKFLELVDRQDQKLVIVDFWAPWCGPCRRLSPSLDKIKKTWGDKVEIVKVDVDKAPQISSYMGASGIPDVRIFRKGTQVADFVGVRPYADIESLLKSLE